jgi:F420-non-reducing hydrogenase iron-sulfur subunit
MTTTEDKTKIIGIVCERSVNLDQELNERGFLKDDPQVKIIKVPCSGHIQPIMLETALKLGAEGVFATGCRMGDCHYREGNKFLKERLIGTRMPKLKPNVDKRRVRAYWLSALETMRFKTEVCAFHQEMRQLDSNSPAVSAGKKS